MTPNDQKLRELAEQAQEDINELLESGQLEESDARIRDLLKEVEGLYAQSWLDEAQCNLVSEMVWHRRSVAGLRPLVSTRELRSLPTAILSAYCEAISIVIADKILEKPELGLSEPARRALLDSVIFMLMRFFPFKIPFEHIFEHEYPDYIRQPEEADSEEDQLQAPEGFGWPNPPLMVAMRSAQRLPSDARRIPRRNRNSIPPARKRQIRYGNSAQRRLNNDDVKAELQGWASEQSRRDGSRPTAALFWQLAQGLLPAESSDET